MNASAVIVAARTEAGLSQRALAERAGMAQPAVARIETGAVVPNVSTLNRLLEATGHILELHRQPGTGIDRSVIRELLALSPRDRFDLAVAEARSLDLFLEAGRR